MSNHDNETGYDMLLAQMEMSFHISGVGHKNSLNGDCIFLTVAAPLAFLGEMESIS